MNKKVYLTPDFKQNLIFFKPKHFYIKPKPKNIMKRSSRRWKKKRQMRWKWQRKRMRKEKRRRKANR